MADILDFIVNSTQVILWIIGGIVGVGALIYVYKNGGWKGLRRWLTGKAKDLLPADSIRDSLSHVPIPPDYADYRVVRPDPINEGVSALNSKPRKTLLLIGVAGVGKTALAAEIVARLLAEGEQLTVASISWIDVKSRTVNDAKARLNQLLTEQLSKPIDIDRITSEFTDVVLIINDFERACDFYADRYIAKAVLGGLESRHGLRLIVTCREVEVLELGEDVYYRQELIKGLSDENRRVIHVPRLDQKEGETLLTTLAKPLKKDNLALHEQLVNKPHSVTLTPLEALLAARLAIKTGNVPKHWWGLAPSLPEDTVAGWHDDLVARLLRKKFPALKLYEHLAQNLSPSLIRPIAQFFSLGLQRARVPLTLKQTPKDLEQLFVTQALWRGGKTEVIKGLYELYHPTVAYLAAYMWRGDLSFDLDDVDTSQLDTYEAAIIKANLDVQAGSQEITIDHKLVEHEPIAVTLLFARALGVHSEIWAYLLLEEEDDLKELRGQICKTIVAECQRVPALAITAMRLAELVYQQLDLWDLAGAIVASASNQLGLGQAKKPLHWRLPGMGAEYLADLSREYVRQGMIIHWLEENLEASSPELKELLDESPLPTSQDLEDFQRDVEQALQKAAPDSNSAKMLRTVFANYCAVICNAFSCAFQIPEVLRSGEYARAYAGHEADRIRCSINLAYSSFLEGTANIEGKEPGDVPILGKLSWRQLAQGDRLPVLPSLSEVRAQNFEQEAVYVAYFAARLRLARRGSNLEACHSLLEKAQEYKSAFPGDEWISYQIDTARFCLAAWRLLDEGKWLANAPEMLKEEWHSHLSRSLKFFDRIESAYDAAVVLWTDLLVYYLLALRHHEVPLSALMDVLKICDRSLPLRAFLKTLAKGGETSIIVDAPRGQEQPFWRFEIAPPGKGGESTQWDLADLYQSISEDPICFHAMAKAVKKIAEHCEGPESGLMTGFPNPDLEEDPQAEPTCTLADLLEREAYAGGPLWSDVVTKIFPDPDKGEPWLPPAVFIEPLLYRGVPKGLELMPVRP